MTFHGVSDNLPLGFPSFHFEKTPPYPTNLQFAHSRGELTCIIAWHLWKQTQIYNVDVSTCRITGGLITIRSIKVGAQASNVVPTLVATSYMDSMESHPNWWSPDCRGSILVDQAHKWPKHHWPFCNKGIFGHGESWILSVSRDQKGKLIGCALWLHCGISQPNAEIERLLNWKFVPVTWCVTLQQGMLLFSGIA